MIPSPFSGLSINRATNLSYNVRRGALITPRQEEWRAISINDGIQSTGRPDTRQSCRFSSFADDKTDFFNFAYLQFRRGRLRSRSDKTHAKSGIYLRQNAPARLAGSGKGVETAQAPSDPSTLRPVVDGSSSCAFTGQDRMQISSGLITRHAYYMRSRIARKANRKPIYLTDDKKKPSPIRRSLAHGSCRI